MKGKLAIVLVLLLILLISLLYYVTNSQNSKLISNGDTSKGDTFIYDRFYLWESNDPIINPPSNTYFYTNNNSQITLRIANASSQIVNAEITTKFQNGTETTEPLTINIQTGENSPTHDFLGDTRLDKNFNVFQTNATNIDYAQTTAFKDIQREVGVFSSTNEGQTIFKWGTGLFDNYLYPTIDHREIFYDTKTKLFLEYQTRFFMHNQNNINLNATLQQFIIIRNPDALVNN